MVNVLCVQVCAFFDDATLANSLPNGKRKRGLNDNRKGLDQNIVGAIKGRRVQALVRHYNRFHQSVNL